MLLHDEAVDHCRVGSCLNWGWWWGRDRAAWEGPEGEKNRPMIGTYSQQVLRSSKKPYNYCNKKSLIDSFCTPCSNAFKQAAFQSSYTTIHFKLYATTVFPLNVGTYKIFFTGSNPISAVFFFTACVSSRVSTFPSACK